MAATTNSQAEALQERLRELRGEAMGSIASARWEEAAQQYKRLIELHRRALGSDHEDTLNVMSMYGVALMSLNQLEEAEAMQREVLQVKQQSPDYGMEHPSTFKSVFMLSELLLDQRRHADAELMLRKVHATTVKVLGAKHEQTLQLQMSLAKCLTQGRQIQEAEKLLHGALEHLRADHNIDEAWQARVMQALAQCCSLTNRHDEAEAILRDAVRYCRHVLGEMEPLTIECMLNQGDVLVVLGRLREAEVVYTITTNATRAMFGWGHERTMMSSKRLALCLLKQRKLQKVEELLRETLSQLQKTLGPDHKTTVGWMGELARFLGQNGKEREGRAMFMQFQKLWGDSQK